MHQQFGGGCAGRHLCEFQLDRLVLGDGLAKSFTFHSIVQRHVSGAFCHARAACGDINAAEFQPTSNLLKASPFLAAH